MSESSSNQTVETLEVLAKRKGLIVFCPNANELFLDLDDGALPNQRVKDSMKLSSYKILGTISTVSPGGSRHDYIRLDQALPNWARLILQACLNSDAVKEFLSLLRVREGCEVPSVLFETPQQARKVKLWRKRMERLVKELA